MSSKMLVISEGPPPLGDTPAEGGALRAWGLSKGFASNGFTVTFAYRSTFKIGSYDKSEIPEGINLAIWDGESIDDILSEHLIVVMRYAMGEAAEITSRLSDHHILVSDSYIPISIEVSARNSSDEFEQHNYLTLQHSSMIATQRADYILYASPAQKLYYLGYLSGINKLNPKTYRNLEQRMFEVPYGIDPNDRPDDNDSMPKNPTLLWYGAFYSWFDMATLIKSILQIKKEINNFKLIIAGSKNPYNKDPGILAHYEKTISALSVLGDTVEFIEWHPYKDRFSVYKKASAIITQNHAGFENELAWRTRLMDYVLAGRPILTNGGDPLGEDLITRKIAFRADSSNLLSVFMRVIKDQPDKEDYENTANAYAWDSLTKRVSKTLLDPSRLESGEMKLRISLKYHARVVLIRIASPFKYLVINGPYKTAIKIYQRIVKR